MPRNLRDTGIDGGLHKGKAHEFSSIVALAKREVKLPFTACL